MIKLLVAARADVTFVNSHNETLNDALRVGRAHAIAKDTPNQIFINARYDECEQFVVARQRFLAAKAESKKAKKRRWRPKSYHARVIAAFMKKHFGSVAQPE
jgi:Tfp pilus assembly protein FimT